MAERETTRSRRAHADRGFTLVELLIVIVILGVLASVAVFSVRGITDRGEAAACAAELRTLETAVEVWASGHLGETSVDADDLIAAGLLRTPPTRYTITDVTTITPTPGGGCAGVAAPTTSVGTATSLVPATTSSGAAGVTTVPTTVPTTAAPPTTAAASTTVAVVPAPSVPAAHTVGFTTFVCGDTHLAGGESYGTIAVAGNLSFSGSHRIATQTTGSYFIAGSEANTSLLVGGRIDWATSSGTTRVKSGVIKVGDASNLTTLAGNANQTIVVPTGGATSPQLRIDELRQTSGFALSGGPAFSTACPAMVTDSDALTGQLPSASPVELRGQNGNGVWSGAGSVWMYFAPNTAAVLDTTVAQLAAMQNVNAANGSAARTSSSPLIINVMDAGAVSFVPPTFTQNYPRYVLWNFPNASQVTTTGTLWGTLFAPGAHVVQNADIRGNVVAGSLRVNAGTIDVGRSFTATFPW